MRFAASEYFYWLTLLPLILGGGVAALLHRQKVLARVADPELLDRLAPERSLEREILKLVLIVIAIGTMVVALARPQFGTHSTLVKRRGVDVVVALDTSKSMLARDVSARRSGNRLKRAKMEINGLIDRLQGDRVGLVSFSGAAFVQCPLTSDYAAAKLFLRAMTPGSIPIGGTNLSEALRAARQMFDNARGGSRSKVIVLLSDGEDHEGGYEEELSLLKDMGVIVHTVGIGTRIGEVIPDGDGRYMRDDGKTIMTRMQEGPLLAIAEATGGVFVHSAAGDLGFEAIFEELSRLQKSDYEARVETVYEEKFQLFAFLALFFLLGATLVPSRSNQGRRP